MLRVALAAALALGAASCATRGRFVRWEDVEPDAPAPPRVALSSEKTAPAAPVVTAPALAPPPSAPASARIAAPAPLVVHGATVEDGGLAEVPALDLACIADARALVEPALALERLADSGRKVGATLGSFTFVVLERDPALSLTDPPPLACRPLEAKAPLQAPLSHQHEPASRWLVRRARGGVAIDTAALLAECDEKGLTPSGRPRVLVDEASALVALAVPVGGGS